MEKEKSTFKQGTRKTKIGFSGGGGNIGGLLLLGGALLAVGSLVVTFASRKGNKRRDSDEKSSQSKKKEAKASQGLPFILQTSSPTTPHGNQCCTSNGSIEIAATHIDDPSELTSTQSLILEENIPSETNSQLENSDKNDQEINLGKGSPLMGITQVKEGVDEVEEADAIKISVEEILLVQSTDKEDGDEEEKKQAKEKLLLEEKVKAQEEEQVAVETYAEKTSSNSVEEDGGDDHLGKESPLIDIPQVKTEETTDKVEEEDAIEAAEISIEDILSVQSIDEEEDDNDEEEENKQAKEKLLLEEKIKIEEEEEQIATKTCAEKTSVEEDDGVDCVEERSPLMTKPEVKQEEVGEEEPVGVLKISIEKIISSVQPMEKEDEEEKKHSIDNQEDRSGHEHILKKSDQLGKENSTSTKKEENLEFPVWNKQATKYLRKWKSADKNMIIMATILLFLLPIVMCYIIFLRNNL